MAGTLRVTQLLQPDGTPFQYSPRNITQFNASGTWTKPSWCKTVKVRVLGAGGGGCGYGEGGGAGGYAELTIVNPPASVAVTVGIGGAGRGYYQGAPAGGTSSFGSYVSATGGYGANNNTSHTGGYGGIGVGGQLNVRGGCGGSHTDQAAANPYTLNYSGGVSYFGGPGAQQWGAALNKVSPGAPGAGGAGGARYNSSTPTAGQDGENGLVIVEEYN